MKTIKIFTSPTCSYCERAKELFAERGLKFDEVDVTKDIKKAGEVFQKYGKLSLPVIFIGDEPPIFGFNRKKVLEALEQKKPL